MVGLVNKKHCTRRAPCRANTWDCWFSYSSIPVLSSSPLSPSVAFPLSELSKPHCKGHPTGNAEPRGDWTPSASQGADSSGGRDPQCPWEHRQWWQHQDLSDDSNVWLSHSSLHTPPSGQPRPVFLLALYFSLPFFVLRWQMRKMFSSQLWLIATLPKNSRVLNCSFPGAAKHIPVFTPAS